MTENIVIAGAGHAAGQLVASFKQRKFAGKIILLGDESYLPYQRPPLSKKFLAGKLAAERLLVKPPSFYEDPAIELRLDTLVTGIDRRGQAVLTESKERIPYGKLVLALGSRVRRLRIDGNKLAGVHYLRRIADVEKIQADLGKNKNAVIVGAGYI